MSKLLISVTRRFALAALLIVAGAIDWTAHAQSDPLPSWNDGATKTSITDFVARVTTQGGPDFVPVEQRIATFDNDGTLWVEQPIYVQFAFALDRVKTLAPLHPEWKDKQPFKAVLDGDMKALMESGERGLAEIMMVTHAGMNTAEFEKIVTDWLATARDARSSGPIPNWSTSRCSNCWPICARTASRPSSYPAAASNSCGRGRSGSTAFRPSR